VAVVRRFTIKEIMMNYNNDHKKRLFGGGSEGITEDLPPEEWRIMLSMS
jgi:hypothetical protein